MTTSDEAMRELERRVAAGDADAVIELRERRRSIEPPLEDHDVAALAEIGLDADDEDGRSALRLMRRGLPKWPQMVVTGERLEQDQAKEVIRRTDRFFVSGFGGNDRNWEGLVKGAVRMPDTDARGRLAWDAIEHWRRWWGCVSTEYVHNDWVACAFIGGPHGWCHPDGVIGFVDNVGKYPGIADVAKDWLQLARTFPFIDVSVTLMSGESCEENAEPVVSIRVVGGKVRLVDPGQTDVHGEHARAELRDLTTSLGENAASLFLPASVREVGIPRSWIDDWAAGASSYDPQAGPEARYGDAK